MTKKIYIIIALLSVSLTFSGQMALSDQQVHLGGGLVGTTPQVIGTYRIDDFGLKAGFYSKESKMVVSTGARYYVPFDKIPAAEPYLGASLLFTGGDGTPNPGPDPPPPPPNLDGAVAASSTDDTTQRSNVVASLTGGFEISLSIGNIPTTVWAGGFYVTGQSSNAKVPLGSGVSIGVKFEL